MRGRGGAQLGDAGAVGGGRRAAMEGGSTGLLPCSVAALREKKQEGGRREEKGENRKEGKGKRKGRKKKGQFFQTWKFLKK
jgi:hypothetical protein